MQTAYLLLAAIILSPAGQGQTTKPTVSQDWSLVISLQRQTRCGDFREFYEERLQMKLDFMNRRDSPATIYFKDIREIQLAALRSDLLEDRPAHRFGGDHILSPGFRGARYDMTPGPAGVETRFITEAIPVARGSGGAGLITAGHYFLRIVESLEVPVNREQTQFATFHVTSEPIEVRLPVSPELRSCSEGF